MKALYIALLIFLLPFSLFAQWGWQNPLPQGNTLNDIDFLDNFFGIAVGNTSTIMKTTDGGLTWSLKESHRPENIHKVEVVSNEVAYALGYYFIIKTTDSGENWFTITNPTSFYLTDIFFLDEMKGYIIGSGGVMYYTDDGGNTWTSRNIGTTSLFKAIYFLNENIGVVAGYNTGNYDNIIIKTTDGGITWLNCSITTSLLFMPKDIILTTELKVFVISNEDLFYTSDGGGSWSQLQLGSSTSFASIAYYDSLNVFISGINKIYKTINGGATWQDIPFYLGNSIWLYGISSPTENLTFAAGEFGRMVYSIDGGSSWEQISSGPLNTFRDVSFYNENYGIAVGDGIFATSNGGNSWILSSAGGLFFRCTRPSLNICFAAGSFNILKSTDRGFTWTRHPISDDHYFMTISFADTLNGMASAVLGAQGKIFRTFDSGETWQQITSIQGHYIYDICFVDSTTAYACSGSTKVFKTTDGGYTWSLQNTGVSGTILYGIHFVNKDVGYTVGYPGVVIKTINGGQNWQQLEPNLGNGLGFYQVHFKDENNGLVAGEIVAHTSDGGQTWTGYELFNDYIKSAAMVTDSIWYAVGQYGAILKTYNDIITYNEEKNDLESIDGYFLSQNYPNPFNPETTIKYQISELSFVTLIVYDVLGSEVTTLVKEEKQAGTYEITWYAENLPSGIYFYQLKAGSFVETKKMVLMK